MKKLYKLSILVSMLFIIVILSGCAETAENEHLPEYCQTYSGFMSTASKDLYDLLEDINRDNYLSVISTIDLEFEVNEPGVEVDLNGIQCFQNLTSLSLIGQSFKDISEISALKNIQKISLVDTSVVSIDSFKNLSKVNSLTISNAKSLQSVDGIEEMTKLINLDLTDNGIVNIDGLNNLINLETLDLSNNEIVSFPSINQLVNLTDLTLNNNNITYLGDDLSGLSNLETFEARYNNISDISALDDLTSLVTLDLSHNNLGAYDLINGPDFSSLENAPFLEEIYLNDNNLTSIEGLRGKDLSLRVLDIHNNQITDITPISEYTDLEDLVLYNNSIVNINNLSGMTNLEDIDLSNNDIVDFTDLLTLPNVETVNLRNNKITFIPDITGWSKIVSIDLHSNLLTDTSGVNGSATLEELIIANNGLTTLSGISNMPYLETLVIDTPEEIDEDTGEVIEFSNPNLIDTIEDSFNNLERYILTDSGDLIIDFNLEPHLEIYGSFNDLINVVDIDFSDMEIDYIDEFSINLPNLRGLDVSNNNITDLSFILGNVELIELRINNNSFNNLEIISGVTTTDLANLQNVFASDIAVGNDLNNAFNELNNLSYLDLTGTNITSINNSFNKLPELSTFLINSATLESIVDSFNQIFASYSNENTIKFTTGSIGIIDNSFNGGTFNTLTTGNYDQIVISNQTPLIADTVITDSFNNISAQYVDSVVISSNNFKDIDNSFNDSLFVNMSLSENKIETFTNSLTNTVVDDTLYLNVNKLEDITTISNISSVVNIELGFNLLTSVAAIDGINSLEFINIKSQYNTNTLTYTLISLDGLNNMETLIDFDISLNQFDSITGLKNIGITEFTYQIINNNNHTFSVDSLAFTNTPIETMDLDGSVLTDISFLSNLDVISELVIDVNVDPSTFSTATLSSTLTVLDLFSLQEVADFSIFNNYDTLTTLIFDTDANTTINNLDTMDGLVTLTIVNESDITSISNSFNSLDSYSMPSDYLSNYTSLTSITNSFDDYDSLNYFEITDDMNIVNSLNNAQKIYVTNTAILSPNFDTLSFDSVDEFRFSDPQYTSYTFLDGYLLLESLVFDNLDLNITDLNNSNIINIDITILGNAVNTLDLAVNSLANIQFITGSSGLITIDSNASNYDITGLTADITINHLETTLALTGNVSDVVINNINLTTLDLTNLVAVSLNVSSPDLSIITNTSLGSSSITTSTITTDASLVEMTLAGTTVNLTANNANDITVHTVGALLNLYNTQTIVTGDIDTDVLNFYNASLQSLELSSPLISEFNIDSAGFNNLVTSNTIIDVLNITSNSSTLSIVGSISESNILNNSLNDLTILGITSSIFNVSTSNSEAFNLDVNASTVNFTAANLPSITVSNSSTVTTELNLGTMNGNSNISLGSANINSVDLTSTVLTFNLDGSALSTATLDLSNASSINLDASNAQITIDSTVAGVTFDAVANILEYINPNATSFGLTDLSNISSLNIDNSVITSYTLGNATITNATIISLETTATLTSLNMSNLIFTGNLIQTFNANIGSGNITYASTKTGSFTTNVTANNYSLDILYDDFTLDTASSINNLAFTVSDNLTSINTSAATINSITTTSTAALLNLTGSNITGVTVNSSILNNFISNVDSTTLLNITTTTLSNVAVNNDTSSLILTTPNASETTIVSAVLDTVNTTGNDIYYELSKPLLTLTLDGTTDFTYITSSSLVGLNIASGSSITNLKLTDTSVDTLDLTNGLINTFEMVGSPATLNIVAPQTQTITLNSNTLDNLTVDGSNAVDVVVNADSGLGQTSLSTTGSISSLVVTNDSLVSYNALNLNIASDLSLVTDSLNSYSETTSSINDVSISSLENTVSISTLSTTLTHSGNNSAVLNITTTVPNQILNTTASTLNFTAPSSVFSITGDNVNSINGAAETIELNSTSLSTTNIDLTVTSLSINNVNSSSLQIAGTSAITNLTAVMDSLSLYSDISGVSTSATLRTLTASLNATSSSTNTYVIGDVNGTLNIDILGTNDLVISNMKNMVTSNSLNSFSVSYVGELDFTINFDNMSDISLSSATLLSNTFTGSVANLELTTMGSTNYDFSSLTVNNKLTMNNLGITNLSLITPSIITNASAIEVNSLDSANTEDIVLLLKDTGITLTSPIVESDIYDYYYNLKLTELTDQEAIDNLRYNGFRSVEVNNILTNTFRINEYFDYVTNAYLSNNIDTQTYDTMQYYYDTYLVGIGSTEEELIAANNEAFVQAIKDSIQATLNDTSLIIDEDALNLQVTNSIIAESEADATTKTAAIGFIIG